MSDEVVADFLAKMKSGKENRTFDVKPLDLELIKPAGGLLITKSSLTHRASLALYNYNAYNKDDDVREIISRTYCVAVMARSADKHFMTRIRNFILDIANEYPDDYPCERCNKNATFHVDSVREILFPELTKLRDEANNIIHTLDNPEFDGFHSFPCKIAFDYCYQVFTELVPADLDGKGINLSDFPILIARKCKNIPSECKVS